MATVTVNNKKLNDMNARDAAIKSGLTSFIERPYIYSLQISVPPSTTLYNMGVPSTPYVLNIQPNDFSWIKTMAVMSNGTRLARVKVKRSEDGRDTTLTAQGQAQTAIGYADGYIPLKTWAGTGKFPYIKKPPEYCKFNVTRTITLADESGAAVAYTAYIAISGTQFVPANGAYRLVGPWSNAIDVPVSTNRIAVTANGTKTFNVTMQDGDFVCTELFIDAQAACLINVTYNSIPLTDGYIHSSNIDGESNVSGTVPNILTSQMEVINNGVITISINDISGAPNNVDVSFGGFLLIK